MNQTISQVLTVYRLCFSVENKDILKEISFSAGKGEFIGIIGQNGAGKSTLMKCIRGLIPQNNGEVFIKGQALSELTERQTAREIAYMQQDVNTDFGYTSLEIVLAGRYPYLNWWQNESPADIEIAKRNMAFTGVSHLSDVPVNLISGGERQRVLFAKTLTQETDILLLDEPTASLDLLYQEEIFNCCRELAAKGRTVLMVAHDLKLAAKFCSRLILLADGRILADGKPDEVVTAENLAHAYGLSAAVFTNKVTGLLDMYTYLPRAGNCSAKHVHIIGGGGAASGLIRMLFEAGCQLSIGVLNNGDSDAEAARAFNIDAVICEAFCEITDEIDNCNRKKIEMADYTVLANIYYGVQNIKNLKAAASAKKLYIIEDTPIEERDNTQGEALVLYKELCNRKGVQVLDSAAFAQLIAKGI